MASEVQAVEVIVEVPKGSRNKYARQQDGVMRLDGVLYSSVQYPADYGVVDGTLGEDGGPLDALVLIGEPTFGGCHVPARVIGALDTRDSRGVDHKLVCVATGDPDFEVMHELVDLEPHWRREIETFFATYKALESNDVEVVGWGDATAASLVLKNGRSAARARVADQLP